MKNCSPSYMIISNVEIQDVFKCIEFLLVLS